MGTASLSTKQASSRRRRLTLFVCFALLVAKQLSFANAAFAHNSTITGNVVCAAGNYVITWSVANSETVTGSNRSMLLNSIGATPGGLTGLAAGDLVPPQPTPGSIASATTTLPGTTTGAVTLSLVASWRNPNGSVGGPQNQANSGSVNLAGTCVQPSVVTVTQGECVYDGNFVSHTPVTTSISPASGATVVIKQGTTTIDTLTGSGGVTNLSPGSYTWTATALPGFDLDGPTSGTLNIADCSPAASAVTVTKGECVYDGNFVSHTPVTVGIDPASGATVQILQGATVIDTFNGSGGAIDLAPGNYTWNAIAASGFELTGPTSGTIEVVDCSPTPSVVTVTQGECVYDGNFTSHTPVTVGINPVSGATVQILQGATVIDTLTGSGGTTDLAPGSYTWNAIPAGGFELTGPTSGSIEVVDCSPAPASVQVQQGECVYDGDFVSHTPVTVVIDPVSGATVEILQGGTVVESFSGPGGSTDLSPGSYTWNAIAASGFELTGATSGSIEVVDCSPTPAATTLVLGECVDTDDGPVSELSGFIDPFDSATVEIADADGNVVETFTGSGGTVNLDPGDYVATSIAAAGFELTGETETSFTAEDCAEVLGRTITRPKPKPDVLARTGSDGVQSAGTAGAGFIAVGLLLLALTGLSRRMRPTAPMGSSAGSMVGAILADEAKVSRRAQLRASAQRLVRRII